MTGRLTPAQRARLPASAFAFPALRKGPLVSAGHVRSAIGHFSQVADATLAQKDKAWRAIRAAAAHYGLGLQVGSWRELG
jgi:hypothetical protein